MRDTADMVIKPSKPLAVLVAVMGLCMIGFAASSFPDDGVVLFFCLAVVAVVGLWLWAAFAPGGSFWSVRDDEGRPDDPR